MRESLREKSAFEKSLYVLLLAMLTLSIAVIALAEPEEQRADQPAAEREQSESRSQIVDRPAETERVPAETAERESPPQENAGIAQDHDGGRSCATTDIPITPPEPVTCRSRSAVLTIGAQDDPLLLGDTHARLLRARMRGSTLFARMRIRNETSAEQGVAAGGQEIYMNVLGTRIDSRPVGEQRIAPNTGATVDLIFDVPSAQRAAIRRANGRIELGVTPWSDSGDDGQRVVGVIRARLE